MNAPYYLLRGGVLSGRSLGAAGSDGHYWSSTPNGSSGAYSLTFNSSHAYMLLNTRYYGYSVRCMAAG